MREPLAQRLGGGLRSAAAREQPQRATAGGLEQATDLLDLGGAKPVATGRRQVLGDVEDRLLRVVERRADVDASPRQRDRRRPLPTFGSDSSASIATTASAEVSAGSSIEWSTRSVGLRPMEDAKAVKSPPSLSVADVKTTVFSDSSRSRSCPQTCSGATQSWLPPRRASRSASQLTSCSA